MTRSALLAPLAVATAALSAQPVEAPNLAPSPGFEQGAGEQPQAWRFYSWQDAEGWWEGTVARSGTHSLGLKGLNGGWFAQLPVTQGLIYSVRFHYRSEGAPTNVVLFVREIVEGKVTETILYKPEASVPPDRRGTLVDGDYLGGADEGGWVLFEGGDFVPHEGVTRVDLLIKIEGNSADAKVFLDDLVITSRETEAPPNTARRLADVSGGVVWADDVNQKILPDEPPPAGPADSAIPIAAAGGEYECFQVAITPTQQWKRVSWDWSAFAGPGELPKEAMTCRLIECIPITRPRGPHGLTGPQPDALTNRLPADLSANVTQGFWFAVKVPAQQPAGECRTDLRLLSGETEVARFPLTLKVRGFSIPRRPTLGTYSSFRYYLVLPRESGEPGEVIKRYYRSFFEHRTSCPPAAPTNVRVPGEQVEVDLAEYLTHLRHLVTDYGLSRVDVPSLWIDHRGTHRMPADAAWQGIPIFAEANLTTLNPAFERPFRAYFGQVCETLRREGLFLRPTVRFFDEPILDDPATRNGLRTLSKLILDICPEVTVSIAASDPHPDLTDVIRLWVIHTDAWYRFLPHIEAAGKAGCEVHVYNNGVNFPEHRRLRVRLWPWLLWKYRVDGTYSWWGTVCWRGDLENPWTAGGGEFSGVLLYPPRSPEEHGPIESVRWELYREGLEDYEYLALADRLATGLEAAGKPEAAKPLRDALAQAMSLVQRWPNVRTCADEPYSLDPAKVAEAREALAKAIEGAPK